MHDLINTQADNENAEKKPIKPGLTTVHRVCICTVMSLVVILGCIWTAFSVFSFSRSVSEVKEYERNLIDEYSIGAHNLMSYSLGELYSGKKTYMIPDSITVMPEPDQEAFGKASTPEELAQIVSAANKYGLIGENDLVFPGENKEILKSSSIVYYLDESILTISWKIEIGKNVYNFTEVVINHPSQFRKYITNNEYGSSVRKKVTSLSQELNAVVAMSSDFYAFRTFGVVVYNGQLYRDNFDQLDTCFIDSEGDLLFSPRGELFGAELEKYIADNDINFSLSFGPILIDDHQLSPYASEDYWVGQPLDCYARAAIGQIGKLHYLLCTVDGDTSSNGVYRPGVPVEQMATVLQDLGCEKAYALDGGQTATMTVNGELFNMVGYGNERPVSDIILFATAIPSSAELEEQ